MLIVCLVVGSIALATHYVVGIYSLIQTRKEIKFFDQISQKYDQLAKGFVEYVTPPEEGEHSAFNETLAQAADLFADRYRIATLAVLQGSQGAASRDLTRGLEELGQDEMPAGALLPHLPKSLKKNPVALQMLNNLVMRFAAGQKLAEGNGRSSPAGGSQVKFNL